LVRRRLPDRRHAWFAWNQVMQALGGTPGMERAYTPGEGGLTPGTGVQLPSSGKFVGYAGLHDVVGLSCVAPPPVSSARVALPDCTCFTSAVLVGGICHTLASYVSMHTFPTFNESGGHLRVAARADAAARQTTARLMM